MTIPESQLETWSKQGSVTQSRDTYATIKRALENSAATYTSRDFQVFLQGSYGNDTNVYAESDVDVVIRYDGAFYHDLSELPADQKDAFKEHFSDGTYPYDTFKEHVRKALVAAFGNSVKPATKAFKIAAGGSRRDADVVVAFEYRRYYKFNGEYDQSFDTGIAFFTSDNTRIANYPKQHSQNCTTKHQATGSDFKPMVRIFKNLRSKLAANGSIADGVAPSYFIEGLLYNIPNDEFTGTYATMAFNILKWLHDTTDRSQFLCANEQYYLLRDNSRVCWPTASGQQFINAAIHLWNNWS
jgi:hypothetical protein